MTIFTTFLKGKYIVKVEKNSVQWDSGRKVKIKFHCGKKKEAVINEKKKLCLDPVQQSCGR